MENGVEDTHHGLEPLDPMRKFTSGMHHLERMRDSIKQAKSNIGHRADLDQQIESQITRTEAIMELERSRITDLYNRALGSNGGLICKFTRPKVGQSQEAPLGLEHFKILAKEEKVDVSLVKHRKGNTVTYTATIHPVSGLRVELEAAGESHETFMKVEVPCEHPDHGQQPFHEVTLPFNPNSGIDIGLTNPQAISST